MPGEVPLIARAVAALKDMPEWFKAVLLGGSLVLLTLGLLAFYAPEAGGHEAQHAQLSSRVQALEAADRSIHATLTRIENKIDQLLLQLIGD